MSFCPVNELKKHGWEKGSGLGQKEQGIKEAIKVKLKFDASGVGHDPGEQFTHHWWEKAFNDAANNISVHENETGIKIQKKGTYNITTKKIDIKSRKNKAMLYGSFVKSATLTDGIEKSSETNDNKEEEVENDLEQNIIKISDDEIFKACGGRTAHKGARHGLKLNGKLARIAQQEAAMLQDSCSSQSETNSNPSKKEKKAKKRKLSESKDKLDIDSKCDIIEDSCNYKVVEKKKLKKNKKKIKSQSEIDDKTPTESSQNNIKKKTKAVDDVNCIVVKPKKKKKKKKKV